MAKAIRLSDVPDLVEKRDAFRQAEGGRSAPLKMSLKKRQALFPGKKLKDLSPTQKDALLEAVATELGLLEK